MEESKEEVPNYVEKEEDPTEDDGSNATQENSFEENDGRESFEPIDLDYEPKRKLPKYTENKAKACCVKINSTVFDEQFADRLSDIWDNEEIVHFTEAATSVEYFGDPFQICIVPNMLMNPEISCNKLVKEMIHDVSWSRKQMDLYEFYQSTDLSNMPTNSMLSSFLTGLRQEVRPWLEEVTGLKLDYVSASCSMYNSGDYLLVHDDLLKDRQIAFIYYLSPWEGVEEWTPKMGGSLEIFDTDDSGFPKFPVARKIPPKNNQFVFFKVGLKSFHQVAEVTNFDYPRLTINGWFHGATNDDLVESSLRPFPELQFEKPKNPTIDLFDYVNPAYLGEDTKKLIQKRIENNSEICLNDFFKKDIYQDTLVQLLHDTSLKWECKGFANAQNYEVLKIESGNSVVKKVCDFFTSSEMFKLLYEYTELDLAGSKAANPTCHLEVQRWSLGNYTVLGDGILSEDNTLDLMFYLNATEGVGKVTYLSPDEESVKKGLNSEENEDDESFLLTVEPVDNSLNIVYRCDTTTKFTKYISKNTPFDKGPVFLIFCSYKE